MKTYLVCCGPNGRAVLVGKSETEPVAGQAIRLVQVRMVLYWDRQCGGLLGLAARGPKGETRITAPVPSHGDECVRQWLECAPEAAAALDAWPSA